MGKKAAWRKSERAAELVEAHDRAQTAKRIRQKLDLSSAFVIDTKGDTSRKTRRLAEQHGAPAEKTPAQLKREAALLKAHKEKEAKKSTTASVFDLWDTDMTAADLPEPPRPKQMFVEVPAVPKPKAGHSANPDEQTWKEALISAAAKVPEQVEDASDFPVQRYLEERFDEEAIRALTERQQFLLLRLVRESGSLIESPEDFLARVLPTLAKEASKDEVKEEIVDEDEPHDEMPARKARRKTRLVRNQEARQKMARMLVQFEKQKRAMLKDHRNLESYLESLKDENERVAAAEEYNKLFREACIKMRKAGENPYTMGHGRTFEEPAGPVVFQADREKQAGSLRKLKVNTPTNVLLEDRLASFKRRGLIELEREMDEVEEAKIMKKLDPVLRLRKRQINRLRQLSYYSAKHVKAPV